MSPAHDAVVVVVDPRLGAVVPAPAVRTVAGAARVLLDPSLPAPVAEAFTRDLGALPADTTTPAPGDVVLSAGRDPHAPAGSELLEAVAVMDRLRSPGGCPWDAEQTHESLLRYLVEETYELYDALAAGDVAATREELGDVLLQVLFHARVAQEGREAFDVDDVAGELVAKLVGRHPHVFGAGETIMTAGDQEVRWEELKAVEKRRDSVLDGVAAAQPAAALLAKYVSRARRAGLPDDLLVPDVDHRDGTGSRLAALVAQAVRDGDDPEGALRAAATAFAARVRAAEASARAAGEEPGAGHAEVWRRHWAS